MSAKRLSSRMFELGVAVARLEEELQSTRAGGRVATVPETRATVELLKRYQTQVQRLADRHDVKWSEGQDLIEFFEDYVTKVMA